jgi:hypothetical protein
MGARRHRPELAGAVSLRKPLTFGLSFGLTLAAVTWVTSSLALRPAARTVVLGTFTAVSVLETALVTMQAWRGVPSHLKDVAAGSAVSPTALDHVRAIPGRCQPGCSAVPVVRGCWCGKAVISPR